MKKRQILVKMNKFEFEEIKQIIQECKDTEYEFTMTSLLVDGAIEKARKIKRKLKG